MTPPEQDLPRRQILDNEAGEAERGNALGNESTGIHEDTWVRNFMDRLTSLVQKIGRND